MLLFLQNGLSAHVKSSDLGSFGKLTLTAIHFLILITSIAENINTFLASIQGIIQEIESELGTRTDELQSNVELENVSEVPPDYDVGVCFVSGILLIIFFAPIDFRGFLGGFTNYKVEPCRVKNPAQ